MIFGDTDNSGYIIFFDALYIPGTGHQKQALYPDVITVHHPHYYQKAKNSAAPADWDSPTPIPFLSATGKYLVALAAPDLDLDSDRSSEWINITFTILENALKTMGIGAKTSSGYGRMLLEPPPPSPINPDLQKTEQYTKELSAMSTRDVANQIPAYYQRWQQLQSQEARTILAKAIIEKVRQAGRAKASADKPWYQKLQAFLDEEERK